MFKKYKQLIVGIILGALIFGGVSVATTGLKSINVMYNNIKIAVDGKEVKTDSEPFIYEGRTFVPIRVISEALGSEVNWNDITKTVEIKNSINSVATLKVENAKLKEELEIKQIIIDTGIETIEHYESLLLLNQGKDKENGKIPKENIAKEPLDINSLMNYLNNNYSSIETPMGKMRVSFSYSANSKDTTPYDYWIRTDWSGVEPDDIIRSIKYTQEDKNKTKQLLRDFQKNIAEICFKTLPEKKFQGGFYHSWYTYPNIKVDLNTRSFLSWSNFDSNANSDYYKSKLSTFRWNTAFDDYHFTTDDILITRLKLSSVPSELKVGEKYQIKINSMEPVNATEKPTWTSSDESIATVDENGLVTARANGIVFIYANTLNKNAKDMVLFYIKK